MINFSSFENFERQFCRDYPLSLYSCASGCIYNNHFHQHILLQREWKKFDGQSIPKITALCFYGIFLCSIILGILLAILNTSRFIFLSMVNFSSNSYKHSDVGAVGYSTCKTSFKRLVKASPIHNDDYVVIYNDYIMYGQSSEEMKLSDFISIKDFGKFENLVNLCRIFSRNVRDVCKLAKVFGGSGSLARYAGARVASDSVHEFLMSCLVSKLRPKQLFAGATNERYGISLSRVCKEFGVHTICIPHGVSPRLTLPEGIFGDEYYCLSKSEIDYLSISYPNVDFRLCKKFLRLIYSNSEMPNVNSPKIVVATCSSYVEGCQRIIDSVSSYTSEFSIRLHPNDTADMYSLSADTYIAELMSDVVSGKILITKLSSIGIEAAYNGSRVIMVLDSFKDYFDYYFLYRGVVEEGFDIVHAVTEIPDLLDHYA